MGLITRRSEVQILPPPPKKAQVRAGSSGPALLCLWRDDSGFDALIGTPALRSKVAWACDAAALAESALTPELPSLSVDRTGRRVATCGASSLFLGLSALWSRHVDPRFEGLPARWSIRTDCGVTYHRSSGRFTSGRGTPIPGSDLGVEYDLLRGCGRQFHGERDG
jgi:hypothetical protein